MTVKLLLDAIRADGGRRFLVDGFPRNTNNLSGWQGQAGSAMRVAGVLVFDCPEEVRSSSGSSVGHVHDTSTTRPRHVHR